MVLSPFLLGLVIPAVLAHPTSDSRDPRDRTRPWIKVMLLLAVAVAISLLPLRDRGTAGTGSPAWGLAAFGVAAAAAFEAARQGGAGLGGAQAVSTVLALGWTAGPFWASTVLDLVGENPGPQGAVVSILINHNPLLVFAYQAAGVDILRQSTLYADVLGQLHYSYAAPAEMGRFHLLAALGLAVIGFTMRGLRDLLRRAPDPMAAVAPSPAK